MKQCLLIKVEGAVHGVGYRDFAQKHAEKLGVEGSVQNDEEGNVIIYACGSAESLDQFIDVLYKGSSKSKVNNVEAKPFAREKDFRGVFRIISSD